MKTNFERYSAFIADGFEAVTGGAEALRNAEYDLDHAWQLDCLMAGGPLDAPESLMVGSLVSCLGYLQAIQRGKTPVYEQRFQTVSAALAWLESKYPAGQGELPAKWKRDLERNLEDLGYASIEDAHGACAAVVLQGGYLDWTDVEEEAARLGVDLSGHDTEIVTSNICLDGSRTATVLVCGEHKLSGFVPCRKYRP